MCICCLHCIRHYSMLSSLCRGKDLALVHYLFQQAQPSTMERADAKGHRCMMHWCLMPCHLEKGSLSPDGLNVYVAGPFFSFVPRDFSKRDPALSSFHRLWGGYRQDIYMNVIRISHYLAAKGRSNTAIFNPCKSTHCELVSCMDGDVEILSKGAYIRADACDPFYDSGVFFLCCSTHFEMMMEFIPIFC